METGSYTIMAKPIKALELHYQMIQFLKMIIITDPLPFWDYSGLMKQIIQKEHNMVKTPNWLEANQLTIYNYDRRFEVGTAKNKSSKRSGLKLGASEFYSTPFYSRHCRDLEFVS